LREGGFARVNSIIRDNFFYSPSANADCRKKGETKSNEENRDAKNKDLYFINNNEV